MGRLRPGSTPSFAPALLLGLATVLIGIAVTWLHLGATQDASMLRAVALRQGKSAHDLIEAMRWITWAGDAAQRSVVMMVCAAWLFWKKRPKAGLIMLVFPSLAGATSSLLKQVFARPRPDIVPHLDSFGNLSFPSGHATNAVAILLLAALLLPKRHRPFWIALGLSIALLIAASRVLLGVHWPSDVVAGLLLGAGFALAGAALANYVGDRPR
jgi:undecaprenyl-diphosphatase